MLRRVKCFLFVDRYLATGDSLRTIATSFHMGISTAQSILSEVCDALWSLSDQFMPTYRDAEWKRAALGCWNHWNYPNCCGALDGKHIVIQKPPRSGTVFYNYKGTFSICLMALVDPFYKFIMVDVGAVGSNNDSSVFRHSPFGKRFLGGDIQLPDEKQLPGMDIEAPHVIIADEAFPCLPNIMRPFPRKPRDKNRTPLTKAMRIYNYRHSRARMTVECAFGILASRFRFLHRRLILSPEMAIKVVKAACILHNCLTQEGDSFTSRIEQDVLQREFINNSRLQPMGNQGYHVGMEAKDVRNLFKSFFCSPQGAVHWQDRCAFVEDMEDEEDENA